MKNYCAIICIVSFFALTLLPSCADPTTIGSELQEDVNVFSTDTLTIHMSNFLEDSVEIFDTSSEDAFDAYFCGNYNDPVLGRTSASIFTQFRVGVPPSDNFFTGTLDSVILHLPYATTSFYGNTDKTFNIEVYRMTENISTSADDILYTNDVFDFDPALLGNKSFIPNVDTSEASNTIYIPSFLDLGSNEFVLDTLVRSPHLRIPLNLSLGEEFKGLVTNDTVLEATNLLQDFFNGLHIRSVSEDEGIIAFKLNELVDTETFGAGITFYYNYPSFTGDTTLYRRHTILTNSETNSEGVDVPKTTSAFYEPSAEVETIVNQPLATGEDQLYIQGLIGPVIKVEIPHAEDFSNTIINKAELTVTVSTPDDDNRPAPLQIVLVTRDEDGTYRITDDVAFALNRGSLSLFGGREEENGSLRQYTFNLSAAFQRMADGNNEPVYLQLLLKEEQINRMAIYGPEHSQFPAKLSLVYSTLPD